MPQEYDWSSALFSHTGIDNVGWHTHVMDYFLISVVGAAPAQKPNGTPTTA